MTQGVVWHPNVRECPSPREPNPLVKRSHCPGHPVTVQQHTVVKEAQ